MNRESSPTQKPRARESWIFPALAILGLILIPLLASGVPGEGDRWRAARVLETWLDGDRERALQELQEIVRRNPGETRIGMRLAECFLEANRGGDAVRLLTGIPPELRTPGMEELLVNAWLANEEPGKALAQYRQLEPGDRERSPQDLRRHWNRLSYLMALARQELPVAQENMDRVIQRTAGDWHAIVGDELDYSEQVVVAATLLLRGRGTFGEEGEPFRTSHFQEEIFGMLNPPVAEIEDMLADPVLGASPRNSGPSPQLDGDELLEQGEQRLKSILASLLTLRALVWQDLGEQEESFADRRRVLELGLDPQAIADRWPSPSVCASHLTFLAAALDTRACVLFFSLDPKETPPELRASQISRALQDLEFALFGQRALLECWPDAARGVMFESVDQRELDAVIIQPLRRSLATMYYHRMWIWHELEDERAAKRDEKRIRELGFRPGSGLY